MNQIRQRVFPENLYQLCFIPIHVDDRNRLSMESLLVLNQPYSSAFLSERKNLNLSKHENKTRTAEAYESFSQRKVSFQSIFFLERHYQQRSTLYVWEFLIVHGLSFKKISPSVNLRVDWKKFNWSNCFIPNKLETLTLSLVSSDFVSGSWLSK